MKNMFQTLDWKRDGLSPVQYNRAKRDTGKVTAALKQGFPRVKPGGGQAMLGASREEKWEQPRLSLSLRL